MRTIQRHILVAAILAFVLTGFGTTAQPAIYVMIPNLPGDVTSAGYDKGKWFVADSFSFGVEREMKESGEKLQQEATIRIPLDAATLSLIEAAMAGEFIGDVEVQVEALAEDGDTTGTYLRYKLERCFIKSWSTSGDADDRPTEEVVFVIEFDGVLAR